MSNLRSRSHVKGHAINRWAVAGNLGQLIGTKIIPSINRKTRLPFFCKRNDPVVLSGHLANVGRLPALCFPEDILRAEREGVKKLILVRRRRRVGGRWGYL